MAKIYILYGSQNGNAEEIAKHIQCLCVLRSLETVCQTLNSVKDTDLNNCKIVIICSTTGNGNVPDNAHSFWQKIKNRSLIKTFFSSVDYTFLSLGDTNFDQYCHAGKMIDKKIFELGGTRFFPSECIDDASDSDFFIEKWINSLLDIL